MELNFIVYNYLDEINLIDIVKNYKIRGVILTGGGKTFNVAKYKPDLIRDKIDTWLINIALKNKIPILGICRGMQFLNCYFGGKIIPIKNHVRTKHKIISKSKYFTFPNIVNSYHEYGIKKEDLAENFEPTHFDENNNIEGFVNKKNNIFGMMWHPERNKTQFNTYHLFFKNWFK